jgi:hypothetical protein
MILCTPNDLKRWVYPSKALFKENTPRIADHEAQRFTCEEGGLRLPLVRAGWPRRRSKEPVAQRQARPSLRPLAAVTLSVYAV